MFPLGDRKLQAFMGGLPTRRGTTAWFADFSDLPTATRKSLRGMVFFGRGEELLADNDRLQRSGLVLVELLATLSEWLGGASEKSACTVSSLVSSSLGSTSESLGCSRTKGAPLSIASSP